MAKNLTVFLTGDTKALKAALIQAGKDVEAFAAKTQASTDSAMMAGAASAGKLGSTLTKSVTLPIVALGAAAIFSAEKVNNAYRTIEQRTGATGARLDALKHSFDNVASRTGASFSHVADIMSTLNTRTGASGALLETLTKQFLTLERVAGAGAPTVDQVAKAMNAWKISTKDQAAELDKLFVASQKTGTPMNELLDNLTMFAPTLRQFNFSVDQSAALLASLNKAGIPVTRIMFGLNTYFAQVTKNGGNAAVEFGKLITNVEGLYKSGHKAEALKLLSGNFSGKSLSILSLAIQDGRLNTDALIKSMESAHDNIVKTGDATIPLSLRLKQLGNQVTLALAPIGQVMIPSLINGLHAIVPIISTVAGEFTKLPKPVQEWAVGLGIALAAVGPLMRVGAMIAPGFMMAGDLIVRTGREIGWFAQDMMGAFRQIGAGSMLMGEEGAGGFEMMRAGASDLLTTLAPLGALLLTAEAGMAIFSVATGFHHATDKANKFADSELRSVFHAKSLRDLIHQSGVEYDKLDKAASHATRFSLGNIWSNGMDMVTGKTPRAVQAVDDFIAQIGKVPQSLDAINSASGQLQISPDQVFTWMKALQIDPVQLNKTVNAGDFLAKKIIAAQTDIRTSMKATGKTSVEIKKQMSDWQLAIADPGFLKVAKKSFGDITKAESELGLESQYMGLSFAQGLVAFKNSPKDFDKSRQAIEKFQQTVSDTTLSTGSITNIPADLAKTQKGIRKWMADTLKQNMTFASDLAKAGGRGLNSDAMAQLIVAGPAKAAPILHELLKGSGNDMIAQFNTFSAQIRQQANLAAAQARIVAIATDPYVGSQQKTQDVGIGTQAATLLTAKPMTEAELMKAMGVTKPVLDRLHDEFGLVFKPDTKQADLEHNLRNIQKWVDASKNPVIHIDGDTSLVKQAADAVKYHITSTEAAMTIDGIPVKAIEKLTNTKVKIDSTTGTVTLDADQKKGLDQLKTLQNIIDSAKGLMSIDADTAAALTKLGNLSFVINGIPFVGSVLAAQIFAQENAAQGQRAAVGQKRVNALGNIYEQHTAQIAPAGANRLWAEPETGGEAYIPLHTGKRKRSLAIWRETGRLLGVQNFATGGVVDGDALTEPVIHALNDFIAFEKAINAQNATGGGTWDGSMGSVAAMQNFMAAQVGKPYVWGAVGPNSYDCSGYWSAGINVLHGRNPYQRIFTSASLPGAASALGLVAGDGGPVSIGDRPGSHVAGTINGVNYEATPPYVRAGAGARGSGSSFFSRQFHISAGSGGGLGTPSASGGDPGAQSPSLDGQRPAHANGGITIHGKSFDDGGVLHPGWNFVRNDTGGMEHLANGGIYGGSWAVAKWTMTTIDNYVKATLAHERAVEDEFRAKLDSWFNSKNVSLLGRDIIDARVAMDNSQVAREHVPAGHRWRWGQTLTSSPAGQPGVPFVTAPHDAHGHHTRTEVHHHHHTKVAINAPVYGVDELHRAIDDGVTKTFKKNYPKIASIVKKEESARN